MTKMEIIKKIGLDNYYSNQEEANKRMLNASKGTLKSALDVFNQNPTNATREFIGRVLTGFFKVNAPISEVK